MKTTEFLTENEFIAQDADQMHKTHQHSMLREECYHLAVNAVAIHKLLGAMPENEPVMAWAAEYISLANDHIKSVKEFLEYNDMESDMDSDLPEFDPAHADAVIAESLMEDDDAIKQFLARGGQVQQGKLHKPRKAEITFPGSKHIGGQRDAAAGKGGKSLGKGANTNFKGNGKAVVSVEGLEDDILAMAKKISPNARIRGSREEEIARRDAMMAKRAQDHANAPAQTKTELSADDRAALEAELAELMPKYDKHYQMIDNYTQHKQAERIADRVHQIQNKLKQGVAEAVPTQAGGVDPKIQFLQPTIQFAEKQGYRVTLNPQGRVVARLVNKQLGHTVHIGQFQPSGKGFEVSMADNLDWQTNAWSAKELARDFKGWHERAVKDQDFNNGYNEKPQLEQQGVAEGHADQQRKIFKKNGKPVGEVGIDPEASPGNGNWYVKHYASGYDVVGFDSYEEAVAELKHCMEQGVAEGSDSYTVANDPDKPGMYSYREIGHALQSGHSDHAKIYKNNKFLSTVGDARKSGVAEGSSIMQGIRIQENATGGATGAGSVGAVVKGLGEMPNAIIKRQKAYTNQRTKGGPVKLKKVK